MKNICVVVSVPMVASFEVDDDFSVEDSQACLEAACNHLQGAYEDGVLEIYFDDPNNGITLKNVDVFEDEA